METLDNSARIVLARRSLQRLGGGDALPARSVQNFARTSCLDLVR